MLKGRGCAGSIIHIFPMPNQQGNSEYGFSMPQVSRQNCAGDQ